MPILIQNTITNFISLLDNVMVGQLGTEQMSGVSIVNQLIVVFNLAIFGALSATGLFSSQFFGKRDIVGFRHTFRFKTICSLLLCAASIVIFLIFGEGLISLYLHEGGESGELALTLHYAKEYLSIVLIGLFPYTITQIYASTLRECGMTVPPMFAGILGVLVNLLLNCLLIFGNFGFPQLGVAGAAIATVVSRFLECFIVVLWTHLNKAKCSFITGIYRSFYIPGRLMRKIFVTGMPLLLNETLWAFGQAMLLQCYSQRGIATVSAMNISNTLFNTISVIYLSIGTSVSILLGHRLGAGEKDRARAEAPQMIAFAGMMGMVTCLIVACFAPIFPHFYNTTDEVRALATQFTLVIAAVAPVSGILNSSYFTLRSGGKTILTFLFDCGYVWCVNIPVSFLLVQFTTLPPVWIYICCQVTELVKCVVGILLVKSGVWANDITSKEQIPNTGETT